RILQRHASAEVLLHRDSTNLFVAFVTAEEYHLNPVLLDAGPLENGRERGPCPSRIPDATGEPLEAVIAAALQRKGHFLARSRLNLFQGECGRPINQATYPPPPFIG